MRQKESFLTVADMPDAQREVMQVARLFPGRRVILRMFAGDKAPQVWVAPALTKREARMWAREQYKTHMMG